MSRTWRPVPEGLQRWLEIHHRSQQKDAPAQRQRTTITFEKLETIRLMPGDQRADAALGHAPPARPYTGGPVSSCLPEAAHSINPEAPEAFNPNVLEFFRNHLFIREDFAYLTEPPRPRLLPTAATLLDIQPPAMV